MSELALTHTQHEGRYVPRLRGEHAPVAFPNGRVLVLDAPCASGKSRMIREFLARELGDDPKARALLLSPNILAGTSLYRECTEAGLDAAFYRQTTTDNLRTARVAICSLESIDRVCGTNFRVVVLDELTYVAMGVAGMTQSNSFNQAFGLRSLFLDSALRIVSCADWRFKMGDDEPSSLAETLFSFLQMSGEVNVLRHTMTSELMRRKLVVTYNKRAWISHIKRACESRTGRLAFCLGSAKDHVRLVCRLLNSLG